MTNKLNKLNILIEKLQVERHKELVRVGEIPIWLYDKKVSFEKMWEEEREFINLYHTSYTRFSCSMLEKLRREPVFSRMYCDLLVIPYEARILSLKEVEQVLKARGFYINEPLERPYHFAISSPFYKLNEGNVVLRG